MTGEAKKNNYWAITWVQFRKNKLAMGSLYVVIALIFIGTYAPYISSNIPFVYVDNGETIYPFWSEFFNNRRYSSAIDLFYNLFSFFLLPLTICHLIFIKNKVLVKKIWKYGLLVFALLAITMPFWIDSKPYVRYEEGYKNKENAFPINPFGFNAGDPQDHVKAPGEHVDAYGRKFLLGSDNKSRDVLALLLYGTRISLSIGLIAVGIYISIGIVLGASAGYFGGRTDMVISRIVEIMICFPTLLLIMALVTIFKPSILNIMIIIGLTGWTSVCRLVRAEFLKLSQLDFVVGARAMGAKAHRIIFRHVLPNALGPVLVSAAFGVPAAILTESGLSFLGLGDTTSPSWGQLLQAARVSSLKWWLIHPPGIAIFITVTAMNLMGDGLRDALDPKLRGR